MSKYEELENLAKATVRAVRNAGNDNDAFNMVLINLKSQDRISREDERKKILAKLPKIKEPTIHEAVCDDSECMIRKQNYKGFNECLKEIKQIIIC